MNKKVIGLMKHELGGKNITEFVALRTKTYSYSTYDETNVKKAKRTKNVKSKEYLSLTFIKIAYLRMKSY